MRVAEFEEKSFEFPLMRELLSSGNVHAPGQVLESYLGYDIAGVVSKPAFWRSIGYGKGPRGVNLNDFNRQKVAPGTTLTHWPACLNLFIQVKRPFQMQRIPAKKFKGYLSSPHYRITIDSRQQQLLERLQRRLKRRAAVVYAAPNFHLWNDLYSHTIARTLGAYSSFPGVRLLAGHDYWLYDRPGSSGCAHSKPRVLQGATLFDQLSQLLESAAISRPEISRFEFAPVDIVVGLRRQLKSLLDELYVEGTIPFDPSELYSALRTRLTPVAASFIVIESVMSAIGVRWVLVSSPDFSDYDIRKSSRPDHIAPAKLFVSAQMNAFWFKNAASVLETIAASGFEPIRIDSSQAGIEASIFDAMDKADALLQICTLDLDAGSEVPWNLAWLDVEFALAIQKGIPAKRIVQTNASISFGDWQSKLKVGRARDTITFRHRTELLEQALPSALLELKSVIANLN